MGWSIIPYFCHASPGSFEQSMSAAFKNLLAISIAVIPINAIMIWYRLTQTENFSTTDMIAYPLIVGGGISILILLLNKYLIKDTFTETFNSGKGTRYRDVLTGIGLTAIYFVMFFVERATIYRWIPNRNPPSTELIDTMAELANNPCSW